jgi:peptide methionine sulfoxide reductase msrA/msrB
MGARTGLIAKLWRSHFDKESSMKTLITVSLALAVLAAIVLTGRKAPLEVHAMEYNTLTPEEERVILREGTERPFSGKYVDHHEAGIYTCKRCSRPLFKSESKFNSKTGWPSFDDAIGSAVREVPDGARTEIECANCGGHIGHVFRGEGMTSKSTRHCANSVSLDFVAESDQQSAIFAGGCFWGVEHHLAKVPGVLSTTVGYVGGKTKTPTYREVCTKTTGHAEAVEVRFDASKVSYETLARLFFEIHDPTQVNRQGPDVGNQYRSAVFYTDEKQRETTEKLIGLLEAKGLDVATQVVKAARFWPAEDYHQDYYVKTGKQPYCHTRTKRF